MWTSLLLEMSPEDIIKTLGKYGWSYTELSSEHSEALLKRGEAHVVGAKYADFADSCGVSVIQGHLKIDADIAGNTNAAAVDELKEWLDLYLAIGIQRAVLHPGGVDLLKEAASATRLHDARSESLSKLTDHIRGTNLVICLENVTYAPTAKILLELIKSVGPTNLGICLDTGHLHLAGACQSKFIRDTGENLKALHIADNDGTGDQHLAPFGQGTVDWMDVMQALSEIKYDDLFNFEIPGERRRCPINMLLSKLTYVREIGAKLADCTAFTSL